VSRARKDCRLVIPGGMVVYGFKTDPVGGETLDEPVGLSVVDLPSAVSVADRLLGIRSRQMSFVKPKQGVVGPGEALDGHRPRVYVSG
jgi:hypothetical protein